MPNVIKYIMVTIFCFLFVMIKVTNAQHKPLDGRFLNDYGSLKYSTITVDRATLLPKNISALSILIILEDPTHGLVEKPTLKLIGENSEEQYFDLGDLRFDHYLRIGEAVAFFEKKNRLHIGSRLRGRYLFWNEYSWNGKKAVWLRTNQYNPRDEYLTTLPLASKNYLAQGKINKAIEVISKNKKKPFPEELGLEFLKYSDKTARKMQKAGKINKAFKFMEEVFEISATEIAIPDFKQINSLSDYIRITTGEFENYSGLGFDWYLETVANYAVLLQQVGQLDKSIEILKQLTTISPDKADFYLYLGDSFWLSNNKNQAVGVYNKYIEILKTSEGNHKIVKRILYRLNTYGAKINN